LELSVPTHPFSEVDVHERLRNWLIFFFGVAAIAVFVYVTYSESFASEKEQVVGTIAMTPRDADKAAGARETQQPAQPTRDEERR
jgi:hypothetical protein